MGKSKSPIYLVWIFAVTCVEAVLNYFLGFFLLSLLSIRTTRPFIQICRIYYIIDDISFLLFCGQIFRRQIVPRLTSESVCLSKCQRVKLSKINSWKSLWLIVWKKGFSYHQCKLPNRVNTMFFDWTEN